MMRITRYGQSAVLLEDAGTRLLIDPGTLCAPEVFELSGLDAVLFTHEHVDHCDPARVAGLLTANPTAPVYAPAAVLELLELAGDDRGRRVAAGQAFTVGAFSVEPVGELHQVILPEIARCANSGFVVTDSAGTRLFHPGDSYETVPERVDVLALPLLGPWSSLHDTVEFLRAVAPSQIFAIHDALLSEGGKALFWRLLTTAAGPQVSQLQVEAGGAA